MGESPRKRWLIRSAKALGLFTVVLVIAALAPLRTVAGHDMDWTVQEGDLIWVVPDRVRKADVVLVADPLDPGKRVLRRVVAGPGDRVRVDEAGVRVNGKRLRQVEMGDVPEHHIRKEVIWSKPPARANPYLIQITTPVTSWSSEGVVEVPEGHWYLLADRRDHAVDSRWWGPVPESQIQGVARFLYGPTNTWRESPYNLLRPEE